MTRRPATALIAAAACAAFAVLVWFLSFHSHVGLAADASAFSGFMQLQDTDAVGVASFVAHLCNERPYTVLSAVVLLHAYHTRGPRGALAVLAILVSANVLTQELKTALAAPRPFDGAQVDAAAWPSGHSTAAMALALSATIAAPPALRRVVAVAGGLFAIAVAYSVVGLGWHYPSDALGGFAVAGACTGVVLAAAWAAERRWPAGAGRAAAGRALARPAATRAAVPVAALGAGVYGAGVLRLASWIGDPQRQAAFVAFAGGILVLALTLAAVTSRALKPAPGRR